MSFDPQNIFRFEHKHPIKGAHSRASYRTHLFSKRFLVAGILALMISMFACSFAFGQEEKHSNYLGNSSENTLEQIKDLRIGVLTGSIQESFLTEYAPDANVSRFKTNVDTISAITSNRIDVALLPTTVVEELLATNSALDTRLFPEIETYTAFAGPEGSKNNSLMKEIDKFLDTFYGSETYYALKEKWTNGSEENKTMEDITKLPSINGTIRVITRADNQPFEYFKNGQMVGFEIEILYHFCEKHGYGVTLQTAEFDSLILSVTSGKSDLIVGNLSYTKERELSVDFTNKVLDTSYSTVFAKAETTDVNNSSPIHGLFKNLSDSFTKTFITEGRGLLLLSGLGVTLIISIFATLFGTLLGLAFSLVKCYRGKTAVKMIDIYIKIFQGTPILVMLLIFYYVIFGSLNISSIVVAIIVFSLNSAAYICETFTTCIKAVHPGQREAALASGFNEAQAFLYFIFPIALRQAIPVYRGEITNLFKNTSIVGYIALVDLTKAGDIIRSRTFEAFFPLITIALIYLLFAFMISFVLKLIEKQILGKRPKTSIKGV